MSYNIGPKIGIDGEQEFRDSLRKINDTYKALEAETRSLTASFEAQGDEQGKLEATSKQLQKQIEKQKEKQKLLEEAVAKATAKFGENSIEAIRLRGALYDTQATVSKLESELKDTASQLDNIGDAMEDLSEEADDAGDAVLSFGDVLKANLASGAILEVLQDVGEAVKDIAEESIEAAADIRASSAQFDQAFGDMKESAKDTLDAISDETKIAVTRMQESYTKIFAFTKSVGAGSEEALDVASRAMRAAADSAAYYDKSVEEAAETLQSFLKGNYANDAALGIAATETTRNAKANELYAKSFKELAESQKVDVLLAMVEAGNAASGALGQAAREAGEWTNVNGELAESWRQFLGVIGDPLLDMSIPVIQRATEALQNMTDELTSKTEAELLASSVSNLADTVASATDRFQDAESAISKAAYEADYYVGRLEELESAGLDTAEAQQEYALVVDELNELIPELNLSIDDQTGLINKNVAALRLDIEAWKQNATAKALQEKFSSVLESQGKAQADLIDAQAKLNLLRDQATEKNLRYVNAQKALSSAEQELVKVTEEYNAVCTRGDEVQMDAYNRMEAAQKKVAGLSDEVHALASELDDNFYSQEALSDEIENAEKVLASYESEIKAATSAVGLYRDSVEGSSSAQDRQREIINQVRDSTNTLGQAYTDAKAESLDSINSQIGLFDALAQKSDYSASKILENWQAQQRAFLEYRDNLQKAVDMDLDEVLVRQLSDGSQQSMMILDALVNDTEISIDEINAAFSGVSQAKDDLARTLGAMAVMADIELAKIETAFKASGINSVNGIIAGIVQKQPDYERSLADLAKAGLASYNQEMAINSPARRMIPSGEFTVEGAIVGVENRAEAFANAMSDLALAGERAYLSAQLDRVGNYPSVVQAPVSTSRTVSHNYGGINISIHQQPGESGEDLAYRVMEIIQQEVEAKEAGIGA